MNDKDTVVVPDQLTALIEQARGYVADAMNQPGEKYPPIMATYVREGVPSASASVLVDTAVTAVAFALQDLATAPSTSVREEVDPDLLKRLSDRLAMATPGPWTVQDGCSWRRIGTQFHDGNVLCPTNHPRDNHPDLIAADGKLYANLMLIVEVVNALPTLLAALKPGTDKGGVEHG